MANDEHVIIINKGADVWNRWRDEHPEVQPDLSGVNLRDMILDGASLIDTNINGAILVKTSFIEAKMNRVQLIGADLSEAIMIHADLSDAELGEANLIKTDLTNAILIKTKLRKARLRSADLSGADLRYAILSDADLSHSDLRNAKLNHADLRGANLSDADLSCRTDLREATLIEAKLKGADLREAMLKKADLTRAELSYTNLNYADLSETTLVGTRFVATNLKSATLIGSRIYGISTWNVKVNQETKQSDLIITPSNEPAITVDNIEIAQFMHLILRNEKVRDIIDTMTSKIVLILGRFTTGRKEVLDAIGQELRQKYNLTPIIFDFDKPESKDKTGTVETIARMARFIIADLTDPSCIPHELAIIAPHLRTTPILPLKLIGTSEYSMFEDLHDSYHWVLDTREYKDIAAIISDLPEMIADANEKINELRKT